MSQDTTKDDVVRSSVLEGDRMYETTLQDMEPYLEAAATARSLAPQTLSAKKYEADSFGCKKVASIPIGFVDAMARGQCCSDGKKYDCLSNDPDETARAYLHIQVCHKELLWVNGTPFTKNRIQ